MSDLSKLFYSEGGGFRSQDGLWQEVKRQKLPYKKNEVIKFVKDQVQTEIYNKPQSKNHYTPDAVNSQWHVDIAETQAGLFLVCVDTFSKRMAWVSIANKNTPSIVKGFTQAIQELGAPQTIYSDQEKSIQSNEFKDFLDKHNTTLILTHSSHAAMAERAIRTVKERLAKIRFDGNRGHTDTIIANIVKEYNDNNINKITKLTPNDAAKPENEEEVRQKFIDNSKNNKPLEPIEKDDDVRIALKIQPGQKKAVPRFSSSVYEVQKIISVPNVGDVYKVNGQLYIRSDLLLAEAEGEEEERKNKVEVKQTAQIAKPPSKALKTVKNDKDSTFKPIDKSIKRNKKKQIEL